MTDHAAIVLKEDVNDWGPKPFKYLNCWSQVNGFKVLIESEWRGCCVQGWKGFVLKEKLKCIRGKLRDCHKTNFGQLDGRILQK